MLEQGEAPKSKCAPPPRRPSARGNNGRKLEELRRIAMTSLESGTGVC